MSQIICLVVITTAVIDELNFKPRWLLCIVTEGFSDMRSITQIVGIV